MKLDLDEIRAIAESLAPQIAEALGRLPEDDQAVDHGRIAFLEAEAAQLCGLPSHVLRDARLRGEITGSRLGKRIVYERSELLRFIQANRERR